MTRSTPAAAGIVGSARGSVVSGAEAESRSGTAVFSAGGVAFFAVERADAGRFSVAGRFVAGRFAAGRFAAGFACSGAARSASTSARDVSFEEPASVTVCAVGSVLAGALFFFRGGDFLGVPAGFWGPGSGWVSIDGAACEPRLGSVSDRFDVTP
ncbi:hypothetical protein [Microbacterium caowuchunii]|uniref:hypothetical protein n=1 Tax=Microbacterium caowuchunii TaxID=2614638 RepID=UPI001CD77C4F|nr:hypothetical protein [Microbacterium caowuchunii]